jgi:hypothetical protein
MFNLSPNTTTKMTMTTNDMATQNMLLLTNNILPHRTCLKLGGMIFNKCVLGPLGEFPSVFGYLIEKSIQT